MSAAKTLLIAATAVFALARPAVADVSMCDDRCLTARGIILYFGAGVDYTSRATIDASEPAQYTGFGWSGEVGIVFPLTMTLGLVGAATAGGLSYNNASNTDLINESAAINHVGLKAGLAYHRFTLGVGSRNESVVIKTVAAGLTATRTTLTGLDAYAFANLSMINNERFGLTMEAQYHKATLGGSTSITEITFQMHLNLLVFVK